jgi:hypothetical protein
MGIGVTEGREDLLDIEDPKASKDLADIEDQKAGEDVMEFQSPLPLQPISV